MKKHCALFLMIGSLNISAQKEIHQTHKIHHKDQNHQIHQTHRVNQIDRSDRSDRSENVDRKSHYEFLQKPDPDGIGKLYFGREIAKVMGHLAAGWLERSSREAEEAPQKLINSLGLKKGMAVADIGAGSGYFTRRLARAVGKSGMVFAVDIQPEMIKILHNNMRRAELSNYEAILSSEKSPKLKKESIDLALMVDVYHEFAFPHEMMLAIRKALKPKGRVAFIEYRGEDDWIPIKALHKMTEAQIRKEAAEQGLLWLETIDVLPRQHIVLFEKGNAR